LSSRNTGPEVITTTEEDISTPKAGEVRVKVLAAGLVCPTSWRARAFIPKPPRVPYTPGWDFVGTVDQLGKGVTGFELSQTVAAMPIHGCYAQYLCLPWCKFVPVPVGLDPLQAVALVLNYITAYQRLHRSAKARAGQRVLIHGASGGVGSAMLQLAKLANWRGGVQPCDKDRRERRMARIFITGSTDGLGREAARQLLDGGHQVVLHARTKDRAAAIDDLASTGAQIVFGDLRSAEETRGIAEQVNALGRMDAVIHNAGVYSVRERGATPEGHAVTFAVNTIAPYILTALIERPARLVFMSSGLHRNGEGSLRDIEWSQRPWDTGKAYAESKLQVVAIAFALAQRWPDVLSNAVDPGWARTRMGGASAPVDLETGARTQSWLAASDEPRAKVSGRYWHHQREQAPAAEAADSSFQYQLIEQLGELTGVALPVESDRAKA
jgi:NADPH:quinone reductase-like Zn-dependent oxidoreductase